MKNNIRHFSNFNNKARWRFRTISTYAIKSDKKRTSKPNLKTSQTINFREVYLTSTSLLIYSVIEVDEVKFKGRPLN